MSDEFEDKNEDPSNDDKQIEKKKRGNKNAYKHGFYARHYTPQEVSDFEEMEPLDVRNEIELIRALMRRVLESSQTANTHGENLDTLRAICMGNLTLTRLIRTQSLKPEDPENTLQGIISRKIKDIDDGKWPGYRFEGDKLLWDQDLGLLAPSPKNLRPD